MTSGQVAISAIVPVYNERELLLEAVAAIEACLAAHVCDYEIVIVESGSTDGTAEACDDLPRRFARVRVFHEGRRNGFGSAVRAGAALASKTWLWPLVVDLPFDLDTLAVALPLLDRCDAVLSYRSADPRGVYRRLQSAVFNVAARQLLGVRARHVNSAFKLVRADVFRALAPTSNGWLIDAELVSGLERGGYRYEEIPVALRPRAAGRSSIGARAVCRAAVDLVALAAARRRPPAPTARAASRDGTP